MRTNRELLEKARSGDSSAVDEILARHERQVFRFGLRMCGNEEDARDVLQETLLAAFREPARLPATRSSRAGFTRSPAATD
jgi:RNA polymerase sigma-70 factor (ECF subfamily)